MITTLSDFKNPKVTSSSLLSRPFGTTSQTFFDMNKNLEQKPFRPLLGYDTSQQLAIVQKIMQQNRVHLKFKQFKFSARYEHEKTKETKNED